MKTTFAKAETKVKKTISHDRLTLTAEFPSGASFKFAISRSRESLALAFSPDDKIAKKQAQVFLTWVKFRKGENHLDRINRLEALAKKCRTGKEVISLMEVEL